MRLVAAEGPWARRLAPIVRAQPVIAAFEDYYNGSPPPGAKRIEDLDDDLRPYA